MDSIHINSMIATRYSKFLLYFLNTKKINIEKKYIHIYIAYKIAS